MISRRRRGKYVDRAGMACAQTLLTGRKRQQFFFHAKVPFAGFRCAAHARKAMMFRSHRPVLGCIEHNILPCEFHSSGRCRTNGMGR